MSYSVLRHFGSHRASSTAFEHMVNTTDHCTAMKQSDLIIIYAVCIASCFIHWLEKKTSIYFKLKNTWGTGAPLNSNYLLATSPCMFSSSDSWGCSIADGLKDSSQCHRPLGVARVSSPQTSKSSSESTSTKLSKCFVIYKTF